jgi:hypothetical protein
MTDERVPAPTRGVPVELDRTRRLRYTFATRRKMIEALGGEEKLTASLSGDDLCKVLWYGLQHEDPSLTVEQVEDMVDLENLSETVTALSKALGYKAKPKLEIAGTNPPVAAAETASQV